jgi:hypothetical protein
MAPSEAPTSEMTDLTVNPTAPKGTAKRDALRANEIAVQAMWEKENVFESDAADDGKEKFIVTFPFPYSNGHLHIGHAFSLTKSVFRAQFERHMGKNVLFPFAFHCTGMPIQAVSLLLMLSLFYGELKQIYNVYIFARGKLTSSPLFYFNSIQFI